MPMSKPDAARTWDGIEIAADNPTGSTVVVRRVGSLGENECLVLHRSHQGPDYAGDWAWTSPAGCRQPGEAVYPAALRELAEEAGLLGFHPWAVDFSGPAGNSDEPGRWALFAVDVPAATEVHLVDPEHDRFEWVSPAQAVQRVLPRYVATGIERAARVPTVTLTFRPMADSDFAAVARWRRTAHVREWFDARSLDEESVRARYAPRLRGDLPTRMWIVEVDAAAVGCLQDYRVADHPDYAAKTKDPDAVAIDYVIGDPALVNRGLGTRMIWEFCRDVLTRDYPDAPRILASPSHRNTRSLRVLEKCGFTQGLWIDGLSDPGERPDTEIVCTFDVRHWLGR